MGAGSTSRSRLSFLLSCSPTPIQLIVPLGPPRAVTIALLTLLMVALHRTVPMVVTPSTEETMKLSAPAPNAASAMDAIASTEVARVLGLLANAASAMPATTALGTIVLMANALATHAASVPVARLPTTTEITPARTTVRAALALSATSVLVRTASPRPVLVLDAIATLLVAIALAPTTAALESTVARAREQAARITSAIVSTAASATARVMARAKTMVFAALAPVVTNALDLDAHPTHAMATIVFARAVPARARVMMGKIAASATATTASVSA
mmetsp:Transcript_28056/g.57478  ORF Transcript_28056/g.57478 Transcript_28056/m.57478 type:complete len:274 (+) Transcript_28056:212-1033(+)